MKRLAVAFVLAAVGPVALAVDLRGKVAGVVGSEIRIAVEGDLLPGPGDPVTVSFEIPGLAPVRVGSGKVSRVEGGEVLATITDATGTPALDQLVTIRSPAPRKRVAPAAATTPPPFETREGSVPGTNSPTGFTDLVDATRRDLPTGKLPRGDGWTRFEDGVFTVSSSADLVTYHLVSSQALPELFAAADVQLHRPSRGPGTAGLYVSRFPTAEARAGDLFFGVSSGGTVLQRHDGTAWRNLPGHGTPVSGRPRAEIARRAGLYEMRWNGVPVSSTPVGGEEAVNVFLYASAGVEVAFGSVAVSRRP